MRLAGLSGLDTLNRILRICTDVIQNDPASLPSNRDRGDIARELRFFRERPRREDVWNAREAQLRSLSARYPAFGFQTGREAFHFRSPHTDGLDVSLLTDSDRITIVLGGWYDDIGSFSTAVGLVEMALAGKVRLRVDRQAGKISQWSIDLANDDGAWRELGSMGVIGRRPKGELHTWCYANPML